jgi:lysophospholipase L1-like esterase
VLATTAGLAAGVAVPAIELRLARRRGRNVSPSAPHPVSLDNHGTRSVVWLGDSTAAGVGASTPEGSLPRQVFELWRVPARLEVLAVPGARVGDVVDHQLGALGDLSHRPDVVVVAVGANDVSHLTSKRSFRRNYRQLLSALDGLTVVVIGVPDMGSALVLDQPLRWLAGWRAKTVDRWIRSVAAEFDSVIHVDISRRTGQGPVAAYLSADRYHPNELGYRQWALAVVGSFTPAW